MLNLVIKRELNKILLAISSCCYYVRLLIYSIISVIYNNICKFKLFFLEYSIIGRNTNLLFLLNNLLSQLVHCNHIAVFQIRSALITMMCETMRSFSPLVGFKRLMATRTGAATFQSIAHAINVYHYAIGAFCP